MNFKPFRDCVPESLRIMSDISEINLLKELVRKHTKKHGGNSILCIDGTYLKGYGKLKNIRLNNHDIGQTTQQVLQDRVKNVTSPPKMNHPLNLKEPKMTIQKRTLHNYLHLTAPPIILQYWALQY